MDCVHLFKSPFLISTLLVLVHAPLLTNPLSFNMASFEPNPSKADLVMTGDAGVSPSGSALQLDRGAPNSSGSAFYHKALQLWELNVGSTQIADFTTLFYFDISSTSGGSFVGDGAISFLLLPPVSASHPKPTHGGSVVSSRTAGEENEMVAVEFELGVDMISNRFGINIVSSTKSGTYVNVNGSGGFVSKGIAHVRVDYNSKTKNLSAILKVSGSLDSYHVSYVVDLSVVLPEKVHIGFTASTGTSGNVQIHRVLSWTFSSSLHEKKEETRAVKPVLWKTVVVVVAVVVSVLLVIGALFEVLPWKVVGTLVTTILTVGGLILATT